jgi:peptide/nickel transport system permease protein
MQFPLILQRLFRRRIVMGATIALVLVVLMSIFAGALSGFDPNETAVSHRLSHPSAEHLLGTDELGRDLFARIAFGGRYSLTIALLTALGAMAAGTLLGLIAGFFRPLDAPVMRVVDAMMSFPDILLAIALVGILGPSMLNVVLALVLVYTPRVARVVRASTLVVRELLFVEAARALGISTLRILWRHVLPNLMSPILVQASFIFAYAILAEAALSFLGVGVPPEIPTWGTMVAGSQQYAHQALWIVLFPGMAIIVTALSLQLVGDGIRDLLDPRLRKTL